jgi:hypothetical protein
MVKIFNLNSCLDTKKYIKIAAWDSNHVIFSKIKSIFIQTATIHQACTVRMIIQSEHRSIINLFCNINCIQRVLTGIASSCE